MLLLAGCSSNKQAKTEEQPSILEIGNHKVSTKEFKYIYNKNNSKSDDAYSKKSLDEYMDLFVKFKLKVLEAERLKLDTVPSFIKELKGYQKQLAKPYLSESSFTEKLVQEAYERMKYEVSASHILVKVNEDASPIDTLKAFEKITEIRNKAVNGEDFGELAFKHSDDPSAQSINGRDGNKGALGYFTAFSMVYPFESGAYNTPVGKISLPLRTRFGYHIIKVSDKRISKGEVKVAHIMIKAANGMAAEDSIQARKKINEITQRLKDGGDWNELCQQFSEHEASKAQNGALQPFKLGGRLGSPEFEEAAFSLVKIGDISAPVKTSYGWHIIQLLERIEIKPYEKIKADLEKKIKRDARSKLNYKALITRLKKENNFTPSSETIDKTLASADSSLSLGSWKAPSDASLLSKTLFTLNEKAFTVNDLNNYILKVQRAKKGSDPSYLMKSYYDTFVNESVYEYEEAHLADKYVDYRMLIKEYRDGILLFQLMDDKVWSKAVKDTVGIKAYYEANIENYQWKKRATASIYVLEDTSQVEDLKNDITKGLTIDDLQKKYNSESALALTIEEGIFELGKNKYLDKIPFEVGIKTQTIDHKSVITRITEIKPAGPKALNESRGIIISDYQNHLETEWIQELKQQQTIKVNQEELNKLIKP